MRFAAPCLPRWVCCCLVFLVAAPLAGDEPPGRQAESRFPPLKLPPGFQATLFACDPLIEYPSVVARGPRPGSIFVAVDYLTGLGTDIVRRDEIRLLEDADGDGYADRATVYAQGFNSIQGLAWHDGVLYVMHAPFLSALRDTQARGVADERRDLLTGLGLPPEENPVRLHCANGVTAGHDGWLYLALGDYGVKVDRPEGDRLVLEGGGILRCRPDGHDLHIFARGLRNIYDVALDEELNVFVRDNENDGGTYKLRVYHSFFGADHGYPYLYDERPDEALPPLADLGLGSSAGGVCYLEHQFPAEYRGDLFFCEWGRGIMRYRPEGAGSSFAPLKQFEFAIGADNDPYPFKPTDVIVQHDGSLIVSDWADGQRPQRGRARIYRITYAGQVDGEEQQSQSLQGISQLDSDSYLERCQAQAAIERRDGEGLSELREALRQNRVGVRGRLHAVWILAHAGARGVDGGAGSGESGGAIDDLFDMARSDVDPRVRAQAIRALADLGDPVLVQHRLDVLPGDATFAGRLAALTKEQDPRVLLELVIALGRLRWDGAPDWLAQKLIKPDQALTHAAIHTLRRSGNWPALLTLLDKPDDELMRSLALRALADCFEPVVVAGLIERLRTEPSAARRREYADHLTRVYKKPGPLVYWGFRPGPRPANSVGWEKTDAIAEALDRTLTDRDPAVRLATLLRMQQEKIPTQTATLASWLQQERQAETVAAILKSLSSQGADEAREPLTQVIRQREHSLDNRLRALAVLATGLDDASGQRLLDLAAALEEGPVLAEVIRGTSRHPRLEVASMLRGKLGSPAPEVRAVAIEALAKRGVGNAEMSVLRLLEDGDVGVRRAAAAAAGRLAVRGAVEPLLTSAVDSDVGLRQASLDSLRMLREPRVLPLAVKALADQQTAVSALECISELGSPDQSVAIADLAKRSPSTEVLNAVVRILSAWSAREELPATRRSELDRDVAEIIGTSGSLMRWYVSEPLPNDYPAELFERFKSVSSTEASRMPELHLQFAAGAESRVELASDKNAAGGAVWFATTALELSEPATVEFLASSNGTLEVWHDGQSLFKREQVLTVRADSDRFTATLAKGSNHILVRVTSPQGASEFQLRFRRKSSKAEHELLIQAALARPGNAERGRALFVNAEKSQCMKCHRLGDQGERIGPELTGVGSRFARIYVIESILDPSRTIAPSFESLLLALSDGRALTGIKVAETETTLVLGDNQGQKHTIAKADIEQQQTQPLSIMPEGLDKRFSVEEFVDLITFLMSQRTSAEQP